MNALRFDPAKQSWIAGGEEESTVRVPDLDGRLLIEKDTLASVAEDFGHLRRASPSAVLEPATKDDVAQMITFAREHGLRIAPRGSGHNTFGQSLVEDGIVIRMTALAEPPTFGDGWVDVSAGMTWRQVLRATLERGSRPPVLTHNLGLSVGGTLSVGGIDGGSYRYGAQVDNVLELVVITGEGAIMRCSDDTNPDLFNAVLAGQGQCAVIARARLRLIPAPSRTLFMQLLYDDLSSMLADQRALIVEERFDRISGHVLPSPGGGWQYFMQLGHHFEPGSAPDAGSLYSDLSHIHGFEKISTTSHYECADRGLEHYLELTSNGRIDLPHPWFDAFIPDSAVEDIGERVLAELDPGQYEADFPIEFYPFNTDLCNRPLFRLPDEPVAFLLDVMATCSEEDRARMAIERNRRFFEQARELGSKHYPITAIPLNQADWKRHYGPHWEAFSQAKARYDPDKVLSPGPGIF